MLGSLLPDAQVTSEHFVRIALACNVLELKDFLDSPIGSALRVKSEYEEMLVFCSMPTNGCLNRHLPCNLKDTSDEMFERQVCGGRKPLLKFPFHV